MIFYLFFLVVIIMVLNYEVDILLSQLTIRQKGEHIFCAIVCGDSLHSVLSTSCDLDHCSFTLIEL